MNAVLKRPLAVFAIALLTSSAAMAETINFDEFGSSFVGPSFTSGSLSFAGTTDLVGVWIDAPENGYAYNGTPYLLDGFASQLTVSRSDSAGFTLDSFEMALGWYQPITSAIVNVTYELVAGGTSSALLSLTDAYATFSPGLAITKATFDLAGAPDGYISMDNVNITVTAVPAVPEPGTYVLLSAGLGLMWVLARRRGRRGV